MCKLISIGNGKAIADIKHKYIKNITRQAHECKNISRIVLFGSSLEERCTEKSDIDIAVFGKINRNLGFTVVELLFSILVFSESLKDFSKAT